MSYFAAALLFAFAAPCGCNVIQRRGGLGQHAYGPAMVLGASAPVEESVVKPFRFKQKVLVCNAYPSSSPMTVRKNRAEILADKNHAIPYRECRYMKSHLKAQDRLDLMLRDVEVKGTFEVGELPSTDAVLLLVLEKRPQSPMISFQSFAFPSAGDHAEAQLAVIDTYRGNTSSPHLKMEDHISGKEAQTVSKRIEQLNFNHVYAIEEGSYDATIKDRVNENLEVRSRKVLKLKKNQNYVILRTGEEGHFEESLMVFPDDMQQSAGFRTGWTALSFIAIAFTLM